MTRGAGLPYGTAVWLIGDEIGIPLTGLAEAPTRTPLRLHAYSLGAHFAYGLMTELTRRTVRRML